MTVTGECRFLCTLSKDLIGKSSTIDDIKRKDRHRNGNEVGRASYFLIYHKPQSLTAALKTVDSIKKMDYALQPRRSSSG